MQTEIFRPFFRYAGIEIAKYSEGHFIVTQEMVSELRQLQYIDQWKMSRENNWHHILLDDLSFFLFSEINNKPSFGFYPCPLEISSIGDFLRERDITPTQRNRTENSEEYSLALETASPKEFITPMRYDIDFGAYSKGVHPAVHLHIGWNNQVRIASRRIMNPLAFVLFVIRQTYPKNWEKLLTYHENLQLTKKVRFNLNEVHSQYWAPEDSIENYLF